MFKLYSMIIIPISNYIPMLKLVLDIYKVKRGVRVTTNFVILKLHSYHLTHACVNAN